MSDCRDILSTTKLVEQEFTIEHLILKDDDIRIEKSILSIIHKAREWERVEHPAEFIKSSKD